MTFGPPSSNIVSALDYRYLYPPHDRDFCTPHPSLRNSADSPSMSQTQQMEPSDSISSQDPHREDSKKTKSRRPPSKPGLRTRLRAQREAEQH